MLTAAAVAVAGMDQVMQAPAMDQVLVPSMVWAVGLKAQLPWHSTAMLKVSQVGRPVTMLAFSQKQPRSNGCRCLICAGTGHCL